MADFPALGNPSLTSRDGPNGSSLLSFSSIAGGRGTGVPEGLRPGPNSGRSADFTIDDFPALTPAAPSSSNQPPHHSQILNRPTVLTGVVRDMSSNLNGMAGSTGIGMGMGPASGFGVASVLGGPNVTGLTQRGVLPALAGSGVVAGGAKRPIGAGSNYASKAQPPQQPGEAPNRASTPSDTPLPIPPAGTTDKFGLYGLLDVIRMTDPDMNMLSLGLDLTSLGLNLNSNEPLYATFMSPFSEHPTLGAEPQFALPSCYDLLQSPPPSMTKVGSFSDETLFYIFYAMPRESLQEASAQELYNRNWRFHKDLKLWLSKDATVETAKGAGFERGIFVFFDPTNWMRVKKEWIIYYDQLEERGILAGEARPGRGEAGQLSLPMTGAPPGVSLEFGSLGPSGLASGRPPAAGGEDGSKAFQQSSGTGLSLSGGGLNPAARGIGGRGLPGWPNASMQQQQATASFFGGLSSPVALSNPSRSGSLGGFEGQSSSAGSSSSTGPGTGAPGVGGSNSGGGLALPTGR